MIAARAKVAMRGPAFRDLFNAWVVLAILGLTGLLFALSLSTLMLTRGPRAPLGGVTAVLTVLPAPTATLPGITQTPASASTPSPVASPSPPPGIIAPGAYVQISGTGGDGLRLRLAPSLDSEVRFLGLEAEVFQVRDGPRQADGYTWWHLVAPYDENRNGWAVSDYLSVIQSP